MRIHLWPLVIVLWLLHPWFLNWTTEKMENTRKNMLDRFWLKKKGFLGSTSSFLFVFSHLCFILSQGPMESQGCAQYHRKKWFGHHFAKTNRVKRKDKMCWKKFFFAQVLVWEINLPDIPKTQTEVMAKTLEFSFLQKICWLSRKVFVYTCAIHKLILENNLEILSGTIHLTIRIMSNH